MIFEINKYIFIYIFKISQGSLRKPFIARVTLGVTREEGIKKKLHF